jgi:ankyrin repeat protein
MLHAAASGGSQTIKCFQKYNLDVNTVDNTGVTPLHCAAGSYARNPRDSGIKWLMSHGANIHAIDEQTRTVLHYAVFSTFPYAVNLLLENYWMDLDATDNVGATPLHYVAAAAPQGQHNSRRPKQLEVLLKHGASVDVTNNDGKSSLDVATSLSYIPYVNMHYEEAWSSMCSNGCCLKGGKREELGSYALKKVWKP